MSKRKFQPGQIIPDIHSLVEHMESGGWVYVRHKPIHPGWLGGWSLILLKAWVGSGHFRYAVPIDSESKQ